jgi:hypothetical protein
MDMSATCVLCGKKTQDYAIECPCCGNFYCSDECKALGHQKKVIHYTWLDYKHFYNKIMKSDKNIRVVTICDGNGEILYSGHREGVKNLLGPDESRKSLEMAVKGWRIRNDELAPKIGKVRYVLTEYEKVKRIVIPFGDSHLLYISTEVNCDDSKLIKTIKGLDFS